MNQTIDYINTIILELVEPQNQLKDTLLKVKILAFQLKNPKLKEWVENEINGYQDKEIPKYREVASAIYGNLIQDRGFGGYASIKSYLLPVEALEFELRDKLMLLPLKQSVSNLEELIKKGNDCKADLPYSVAQVFDKFLTNGYEVHTAWYSIGLNSLVGIVDSIKSNLLNFLLELAEELGEHQNIDIMKEKPKIDNLFDKTIGQITGGTVNIVVGTDNIQSVNTGNDANINVSKGDNNSQTINVNDIKKELENFIADFKPTIDTLDVSKEDKEDIITAITGIETQLQREKPKYPIISQGLDVVKGVLIGVAGNAVSPTIIEKISWLITLLSQIQM